MTGKRPTTQEAAAQARGADIKSRKKRPRKLNFENQSWYMNAAKTVSAARAKEDPTPTGPSFALSMAARKKSP
jgi:hypothetical protein